MAGKEKFFIGNLRKDDPFFEAGSRSGRQPRLKQHYRLFGSICRAFKDSIHVRYDQPREREKEDHEWAELVNRAIRGIPEAETFFLEKIQAFLDSSDRFQVKNVHIPPYYKGLHHFARENQLKFNELAHAVFHENYGFGPIAAWRKYPESYAAQIIGRKVWIFIDGRFQLMPFEFETDDRVQKIIRSLNYQNKLFKVSKNEPEGEVDLYTGERVTVMIPPRVNRTVITFRRFLIDKTSIDDQAARRTIPNEAIAILKGISKTHCNTAVVGPVGTGKSTFQKAMLNEREDHLTGAVIEKHYELAADKDFPEKKLISIIADEHAFHHVMDRVLRSDVDYAVVGEVRRVEVEGALLAMEKLSKGCLVTYHTWKPLEIPSQWARNILDLFPGRRFETEMERVASFLDIVIVMMQTPDRKEKKVKGIYELRLNPENREIRLYPLMVYDFDADAWSYKMNLSEALIREMKEFNPEWTERVIQALCRMEKVRPIREPALVFNPVEKEPVHVLKGELQRIREALRGGV